MLSLLWPGFFQCWSQAWFKTGMDHSSEDPNVTMIHTDLDHLESEEEDGEVIELADEMIEDIGMGGEDRTTGKQTFGNQYSAPDLLQKAKLAPVMHVILGERGTEFLDNASGAEPTEMDIASKDLDKEIEKDLEQVGFRLSELQAEFEPPVASEHQPYTALQTQNIPQSHELFSVATREHKGQPSSSALERLSHMEIAGPVEKQVEEKLAILCKDTKTRVSIKMEDTPKEDSEEEEQCAEETAEQEAVASSKMPPGVMQEEGVKPSKRCPNVQIDAKVYSPDPTDWEIFLYVKVPKHVSK
ncbi:hypothetical protein QTP86_017755 [Hemibagrus guttatus]|nr:hypothetical protein QTP86_017755 [Hemibagrus guttatus]